MKVYKVELMVLDFDNIGADGIKEEIENTQYGNQCISPKVKSCESRDIGEWSDEHPLNQRNTSDTEYQRLFKPDAHININGNTSPKINIQCECNNNKTDNGYPA